MGAAASRDPDLASSALFAKPEAPRDAATLIVVNRLDGAARVLMGQRHGGHAFMPNKYVFPGGRLDPEDRRVAPAADLPAAALAKLNVAMRGGPSLARARGLALAAVRETFEETGYILGKPGACRAAGGWADFAATGHAPDLSGLVYIGRAITPPGRTRRFDSRFFAVDAVNIANLDAPAHAGSGELQALRWVTIAEALQLELPSITADTLARLKPVLEAGHFPENGDPVPFQRLVRGAWRRDMH